MQRSTRWIVSSVASVAGFLSVTQLATAAESGHSTEVNNLIDFQCNGAKTLKAAEANYAQMARRFTDQHPVMECLKKKIETLKASER